MKQAFEGINLPPGFGPERTGQGNDVASRARILAEQQVPGSLDPAKRFRAPQIGQTALVETKTMPATTAVPATPPEDLKFHNVRPEPTDFMTPDEKMRWNDTGIIPDRVIRLAANSR